MRSYTAHRLALSAATLAIRNRGAKTSTTVRPARRRCHNPANIVLVEVLRERCPCEQTQWSTEPAEWCTRCVALPTCKRRLVRSGTSGKLNSSVLEGGVQSAFVDLPATQRQKRQSPCLWNHPARTPPRTLGLVETAKEQWHSRPQSSACGTHSYRSRRR
jgi:hypothetical protein